MNKTALFYLLSMIALLFSGCDTKPKVRMRLEIKNPAKAHTFKFYIEPERSIMHYYSHIHGELDGNAEIKRYENCLPYYTKEQCNPLIGNKISAHELPKGKVFVGDSSEYFGGGIIIRYRPKGATKGRLFIDIHVP